MDDMRDKIHGERSFLEKIGKIIPGYSGYKEKLERQEADKMLREYLVQQINTQMGHIRDLIDDMTQAMKIKDLDKVDRPLKKLEKLRDRIKFADHGYTGWFEPVELDTSVLDKMYEFDNTLVDTVQKLAACIDEARNNVSDDAALSSAINALYKEVDAADTYFNERENFILQK